MDKNEEKKEWRQPKLERLEVSLDTKEGYCGSSTDLGCHDPADLFGNVK